MTSIMSCTARLRFARQHRVLPWSTVRFVHRLPPGVTRSLPLVPPMLALGATFGLLAEPVMGRVAPIVMSCIVFAGGAQFAALGVLTAGGGAISAVLAGTCVNLRFLPTGFAIAPALKGGRFRRTLEGQTVVDASFVLAARGDGTFDRPMLLASTAVQAVGWISGTVLGVLAADAVPDPERFGLDAILPAFFLALLVSQLREHGRPAAVVAALAGLITLVLTPLLPPGVPVVAAAAAALVGLRRPR
jgi:predicted branched-subunit amino acid permease